MKDRLAELRDAHDLTQEEAAAKAGVNLRQWQRWEAGDSVPYARNIEAVAEAFGVRADDILGVKETQLDRIETKLDELLTLLRADAVQEAATAGRKPRPPRVPRKPKRATGQR